MKTPHMNHIQATSAPQGRSHTAAMALVLTAGAAFLLNSAPAQAKADGPWLVRAGVSNIEPASGNGRLINDTTAVDVDSQIGPSINVAYFFTPNWAVDVLGALPFEHDIALNGQQAGSTKHLPPTVTMQYHLRPGQRVQPFVGAGLNYTFFMEESLDNGARLDLEDSFGLAAQLGVDFVLNPNWRLGLDMRYIDIDTDASVNGQGVGEVNIDPTVYSLNLGYRF